MQITPAQNHRKKLALALSGCSGRAVVYIGMLDAFDEHGIPVDMIAACSSASIVACSYASGTLPQLKHKLSKLNRRELFELFELSFKGGIFSLDKVEEELGKYVLAENLEDLRIPVVLTASDLIAGEGVAISMGNTMRAIRAACAYPGMFEPVMWGGRVLIDGGLFEIVPVETARSMNADIIVGVDLSGAQNLFDDILIRLRQGYKTLARPFAATERLAQKVWRSIINSGPGEDVQIDNIKSPSVLSIIGSALDYAIEERKKEEKVECDLMIVPNAKNYGMYADDAFEAMYQEGRRSAIEALPKIRELLDLDAQAIGAARQSIRN